MEGWSHYRGFSWKLEVSVDSFALASSCTYAGFYFCFLRGLPFGQPPSFAFFRAAAALARLVARPARAARTEPMSAPHLGHFSLLIIGGRCLVLDKNPESATRNYADPRFDALTWSFCDPALVIFSSATCSSRLRSGEEACSGLQQTCLEGGVHKSRRTFCTGVRSCESLCL